MNQGTLAKKLNISPSTIGMYETNKRQPNYDILVKIADLFNCSLDYLLERTDKRHETVTIMDLSALKIAVSSKKYNKPTEQQKKQIEDFAKFVLKDNKKENNDTK